MHYYFNHAFRVFTQAEYYGVLFVHNNCHFNMLSKMQAYYMLCIGLCLLVNHISDIYLSIYLRMCQGV